MNTPVPTAVVEALCVRLRCLEKGAGNGGKTSGGSHPLMAGLVPAIPSDEAALLCPPDRDRWDKPDDDERGAGFAPVPVAIVEALRKRIRGLEGGARHRRAVLPFGIKTIDERLPEGGLALGALHEVAGDGNGAVDGAAAALFAAGIAARTRGRVLWCVTRQDLFAPALASAGLVPDRVIYVEAGDEKSVLACFEEGLRHGGSDGGIGAVVAEVARLSMTASRRLQLAAEGSGAIGIAIRRLPPFRRIQGRAGSPGAKLRLDVAAKPSPAPKESAVMGKRVVPRATMMPLGMPPTPDPSPQGRGEKATDFGQPTAAVTRWRISALPSHPLPVPGIGRARWRLELIRCRGGESAEFVVEACDAQGRLALPSDLVNGPGQKAIGRRRTAR